MWTCLVAMATVVLDLRMHPFVVPTTIFLDVTHGEFVLALWHVRESEDIAVLGPIWWPSPTDFKGEVRTINDRNICERRSCMKNNGKSGTFKFVSGEERRPSEVQRVSRGWRLPGTTQSSADLTWIRKSLEIQAPEPSEPESVKLELGSCCSDFDKQVSDKICWIRKRQFEIPFRL